MQNVKARYAVRVTRAITYSGSTVHARTAAQLPPCAVNPHVAYARAMQKRIFYRLWSLLRTRDQERLVRLGSARVTCGVVAVIPADAERVLAVRHTYRRPSWGLPGGMLGRGEDPSAALARELREELCVDATVGPLLRAENDRRRGHLTLYYRVAIQGEPRHGIETDAHRYVTMDELAALVGAPTPAWLPLACRSQEEPVPASGDPRISH